MSWWEYSICLQHFLLASQFLSFWVILQEEFILDPLRVFLTAIIYAQNELK